MSRNPFPEPQPDSDSYCLLSIDYCLLYIVFCHLSSVYCLLRDEKKTCESASNECVIFFIVWVKFVTESTLFCPESELFFDFALFGVILMNFN